MPKAVVATAMLQCTFGAAPATLLVVNPMRPLIGKLLGATITDFAPVANIPTFGMCSAPTNPAVIAATSAALGVFTPAPCVPATISPWIPGAIKAKYGGVPALNADCKCLCTWLGSISVTNPGQVTTDAS